MTLRCQDLSSRDLVVLFDTYCATTKVKEKANRQLFLYTCAKLNIILLILVLKKVYLTQTNW